MVGSGSIRNITACQRCRQRRVKCDKQFPKCGNCLRKGDDCLSLDPGTGEVIGRSYVYELETQVRLLKEEVELLKNRIHHSQFQSSKLSSQYSEHVQTHPSSFMNPLSHMNVHRALRSPVPTDSSGSSRFPNISNNSSNENGSTYDDSMNYKVLMMKEHDILRLKAGIQKELPPVTFVEECIILYFQVSNVQLPILNSEYFLHNYFKPLYGDINPVVRKRLMDPSLVNLLGNNQYKYQPVSVPQVDDNYRYKCLFFINIIIAILTSMRQQTYDLSVPYEYQQHSLRYADYIWNDADDNVNEIAKLEKLQSLLLLSTYSIMRPSSPGAWYLIGNSVRLMYDLNLHEPVDTCDRFIQDMKRRIFWSCYSLDEQVSMYFQKPYTIAEPYNVKFPSVLDDSVILTAGSNELSDGDPLLIPDTNKLITHQYIKLRILQKESNDLPQEIDAREPLENSLTRWYEESNSLMCDEFNKSIMEINYHFSITLLYTFLLFKGHSNIPNHQSSTETRTNSTYSTTRVYSKLQTLFKSSERIILVYHTLQNDLKLLNYTWVSINNIFLKGITYLFVIYRCEPIRITVDLQHLELITGKVVNFMNNLKPICPKPSETFISQFEEFKTTVINLINNERIISFDIDFDNLFANSDFINTMMGSINAIDQG